MANDHEGRSAAMLARSTAAMKCSSVAAVNTATNQLDWLLAAPPAGYRILLWKFSGPAVTGANSTAVWTFLSGGTTVATNTTVIGRVAAAHTVTAAFTVPLVTVAQPAAHVPLATGSDGKALHIHAVITDATACIAEITYSYAKVLGDPLAS